MKCAVKVALGMLLVIVVCANIGVAIHCYFHAESGTEAVNDMGKMRALTREIQHCTAIYGAGIEENDKMLPMMLANLMAMAQRWEGNRATPHVQGLKTYVSAYTTAVDAFYASHNLTLYTSPPLKMLDGNGRYNLLAKVRTDDASNWRPVVRKIHDEVTRFNQYYSEFDSLVEGAVDDVQTRLRVTFALTLSTTLLSMFTILMYIYKANAHAEERARVGATEANARTYRAVLNNLNHEFKGFTVRLRHLTQGTSKGTALGRMLDHLNFALSTLGRRCDSHASPRKVLVDLHHLAQVVQTMLPDITIETDIKFQLLGDPGYYYAAMYQISRNAHVHGTAPFVMKIDDRGIVMTNSPGKHHARLVKLSAADALVLCESGEVGTVTSSGHGLRDVQWVAGQIGVDFSIQFLPGMVTTSLLFTTATQISIPQIAYPEPPIDSVAIVVNTPGVTTDTRPVALLVVDDDKIPRMTGKGIAKKLLPEVALDEWDAQRQECIGNPRVCVLGHDEPNIDEIVEWVRSAVATGNRVIALIDYFIEYSGGVVLLGTALITAVLAACKDLPEGSVLMYIRSGNDTVENEQDYIRKGAHGMISKALQTSEVASLILATMNGQFLGG